MQIHGQWMQLGRQKGAGEGTNPSVTMPGPPWGHWRVPWVEGSTHGCCSPLHGAGPSLEAPSPPGVGGTQTGTRMVALALPGASTHILGVAGVPSPRQLGATLGGPRSAVPWMTNVPWVPSALPGRDWAKPRWAEGQGTHPDPHGTPRGTGGAGGAAGPARPDGCGISAGSCRIWGNQLKNRLEVVGRAV